jgi:flagellar biogenesis protein FliO
MNRQNYRGTVQPKTNDPATLFALSPLHIALVILLIVFAVYLLNKFIRWFWRSEELLSAIKQMKKESEETTKLVDRIGGELKKLN